MKLTVNPEFEQKFSPLRLKSAIYLFLNYFAGYFVVYPFILKLIAVLSGDTTQTLPMPYSIVLHLFVLGNSIRLAMPLLKESYSALMKNFNYSFVLPMKLFPLMFFSSYVLSALATMITGNASSSNQEALITMLSSNRLFILFLTMFFAPIVEEILFRGVLYRCLRRKGNIWFPMIFSSTLFGFLHVFDSLITRNYGDLIFLPLYAVMGFFLAYAYEKSGNIYSSMLLHFFNNAVSIFFVLLFGTLIK